MRKQDFNPAQVTIIVDHLLLIKEAIRHEMVKEALRLHDCLEKMVKDIF